MSRARNSGQNAGCAKKYHMPCLQVSYAQSVTQRCPLTLNGYSQVALAGALAGFVRAMRSEGWNRYGGRTIEVKHSGRVIS
jgi:hypothetical protein